MALTEKLENKKIVVIDALSMKEPKTKELLVVMKNLPKLRNAILMLDANHKIAVQASKNVKGIAVMAPGSINAYDVLSHDGLIITKAAVKQLEQHLTSKKA